MAETSETPKPSSKPTWNLEESSVWWLSYFWDPSKSFNWFGNPGTILMLSSAPFFAGAYFGYRMPTEQLEDLIQGSVGGNKTESAAKNNNNKSNGPTTMGTSKGSRTTKASVKRAPVADQDAIRVVAAQTASKALRIATLGTVGTFGLVGAIGFYMSGCQSLEEAVIGTKQWASSWGKSLEHAMGGDQAVSKNHPDVLATKHMDNEDELRYIYDKYIKEEGDDGKDVLWQDGNVDNTQEKRESSPTLYTIYEKYFKKKEKG